MKNRKTIVALSIIVVIVLTMLYVYSVKTVLHKRRLIHQYALASQGDDAATIINAIGKPDRMVEGFHVSDVAYWDDVKLGPTQPFVKYEYHYFLRQSIIDKWIYFGFDEHNKLVTKHQLD
jgi:hypothetical protein